MRARHKRPQLFAAIEAPADRIPFSTAETTQLPARFPRRYAVFAEVRSAEFGKYFHPIAAEEKNGGDSNL